MKMQFITGWSDPAEDQARLDHMRSFYTNLFSASSDGKHAGTPAFNDRTEGCYINYPDADMLRYSLLDAALLGPRQALPIPPAREEEVRPQQRLPPRHVSPNLTAQTWGHPSTDRVPHLRRAFCA